MKKARYTEEQIAFVLKQDKLDDWRREYNHERTHSSLNDMTPAEFIRSLRKGKDL